MPKCFLGTTGMFPPAKPSNNRKKHDDYFIIPIGSAADHRRHVGARSSFTQIFLDVLDEEKPSAPQPDPNNRPPPFNPSVVQNEKVDKQKALAKANSLPIPRRKNDNEGAAAGPPLDVAGLTQPKKNEGDNISTLYNKSRGWWDPNHFGKRKIYVLNTIAIILHFILLVSIGLISQGKSPKIWNLKQDRTYASPLSKAGTRPFLQVWKPPLLDATHFFFENSHAQITQVSSRTCNVARPNYLNFTGGGTESPIVTWTYPEDANVGVDVRFWVLAFFLLSFLFQGSVMLPGTAGYGAIFHDREDDDVPFHMEWTDQVKTEWYKRILYFNWLRFVEYSISGTDVLLIIAVVSGIVDYELLLAIGALSFSCMILGLIAEWSLRIHTVLYHQTQITKKTDPHDLSSIMKRITKYSFWTAHLLGWVCIIIPWHIIFQHYNAWYNQCGSETKPPPFVIYIVWLEVLLFAAFGLVQALQWWWPYKRRAAEVAYIALSLSAKTILGIFISANVLVQD